MTDKEDKIQESFKLVRMIPIFSIFQFYHQLALLGEIIENNVLLPQHDKNRTVVQKLFKAENLYEETTDFFPDHTSIRQYNT